MYKRIAAIAVLIGLPLLIQPAGEATDAEVDAVTVLADLTEPTIGESAQLTLATPVPPTAAPTTAAPITAAPTTTVAPATVDYQSRGEAALASIGYNWRGNLPGWTITFSPGREGVIGYTYTNEHRIEIFVRDDLSDSLLRHVIAHELGHAVDVSLNSGTDRERWQEARGIGGSPWWPGNGVSDYSTGAGDFAECFAAWQVGSGNFRSKIGSAPNGDQVALLSQLAS